MRIDYLGAGAAAAVEESPGNQTTAGRLPEKSTAAELTRLPQDTASLSNDQTSVASLTGQALAAGEARAAKVEALRQSVGSGSYVVDPASTATAMLSEGD